MSVSAAFHRDGFAVLPSVISTHAAEHLRALTEQRFQDPQVQGADPELDLLRGGVSLMRMFEYDWAFRDVIAVKPVADLVEMILGPDCHVISQNALRIPPGKGIVNGTSTTPCSSPSSTGYRQRPGMRAGSRASP